MDQETPTPQDTPAQVPSQAQAPAHTPTHTPAHAPGPAAQNTPGSMPVFHSAYTPEHLNKLFMWWWILLLAGVITFIIFIGYFAMIASAVIGYMLMYKFWNQIQDGYQKTTPGKAIGFMFIPLFNIYWQFVAIHGFAQNANAYADRHGVNMPKINENLTLTQCILVCCMFIPLVNILAGLALLVIGIINFIAFKNASVAIAAHKLQHANTAAVPTPA